ncbi:BTAD domain-containing putative transcriptional regulator [Actinomadura sp. HBU206391]|uniref:BTAD domain-containing putative transcriptional regulator n=1 Tax=Actinomadura sp. HBU206391 TaxID=2731692 RepID=UPI00165092FB|nr:BTAD domain-containing putative transcriptional regulator [Actinomadura sp. HBU206391]MBC6459046.1 winged helix-turn-helix domain-containing protein [Actinomadura sp. HBU206391]
MRFGVLGPLAVWAEGDERGTGRLVRVPEAKVRALLADLLTNPGRPVSTDRLIDDLWGARPPRDARGTLQARVSQLRRTLDEAEPGTRALVVSRPPGYALETDAHAVDAGRFAALTARARRSADPRARAALLTDALALWRGPAFADFIDAEFAREAVFALEEQRLVALEEQAEARLELGEHDVLAGELAGLVARHPLRERLRAAYLLALYRAGRQSEALASYAELRRGLAEDQGLDPGPGLVALHRSLLQQDPSLTPPAAGPRTNLPAALGELIGRERTVAETRALLAAGRLVTLTGPGGVGKTSLALEAAAQSAGDHPDGVWIVELGALRRRSSTTDLAEAVAAALGVRDEADPGGPAADAADRLAEALRTRRLLVVLDNCEHVIEAVANVAGRLLAAVPGLRIMATSREPLGIAGERLQSVPPLESPGPSAAARPESLREFSAVRLFAARAADAAPGFTLDAATAPAVAAICARLDGIPLALELAATRVRALGVRELAARLDDRFRLLTGGRRDAPARQRTLRAMIDWSWEPLTEPERVVLRRLAVHADGCALEAAEQVCAGEGMRSTEVLDVLARLIDRSLVVVAEDATGPRYRLLESVSAYCHERSHEAGEGDVLRRRHGRYYAELAERACSHLRGHEQARWLERLDREGANLREALEGAVRDGEAELALRLVNALSWYWFLRGRYREARRSLESAVSIGRAAVHVSHPPGARPVSSAALAEAVTWQAGMTMASGEGTEAEELSRAALELYDDVDDPRARARAEWFLGFILWAYGDLAVNESRVDRALAAFRELGDRWGTAVALSTRAKLAIVHGDLAALKRDAEESLTLFRELGDAWGRLEATDALGRWAEITGDYEQAAGLLTEGLRVAEALGMWTEVSFRLSGLGRIALLTGDLAAAGELHERARRLAAGRSSKPAEEFAEVGLGLVARRQGELGTAETHLRAWLPWLRDVGGTAGIALILAELGFVAELRGDAEAAVSLQTGGLQAARGTGDPRAIALALEGLAGARALAGGHAEAARLLGAAAATRDGVGAPLPPAERGDVDRVTARVRAVLGETAFAAEFAYGRGLDPYAESILDRGTDHTDSTD